MELSMSYTTQSECWVWFGYTDRFCWNKKRGWCPALNFQYRTRYWWEVLMKKQNDLVFAPRNCKTEAAAMVATSNDAGPITAVSIMVWWMSSRRKSKTAWGVCLLVKWVINELLEANPILCCWNELSKSTLVMMKPLPHSICVGLVAHYVIFQSDHLVVCVG